MACREGAREFTCFLLLLEISWTVVAGAVLDTVGRREMISSTYAISAVLLTITGWAFAHGLLSASSQTLLWTIIFFFASAAASAAYLTVSEIFPLEIRALAIAFFFSLGTAAGGIAAPWLFGVLIGSGSREKVFYGYLLAGALMLAAAAIEVGIGVKAERSAWKSWPARSRRKFEDNVFSIPPFFFPVANFSNKSSAKWDEAKGQCSHVPLRGFSPLGSIALSTPCPRGKRLTGIVGSC